MIIRKGHITIESHLKRHSFYLKPLSFMAAAVGLTGCEDETFYHFENAEACKASPKFTMSECRTAYQIAESQAQENSFKYRTEKECFDDFGFAVCRDFGNADFRPNNFGWVMSNIRASQDRSSTQELFVRPTYLSTNPKSNKFSYLLIDQGNGQYHSVKRYNRTDDHHVGLPKDMDMTRESLRINENGDYYNDTRGVIREEEWDDWDDYYDYDHIKKNKFSLKSPKKMKKVMNSSSSVRSKVGKSASSFNSSSTSSYSSKTSSSKSRSGFGSSSRSSWGG